MRRLVLVALAALVSCGGRVAFAQSPPPLGVTREGTSHADGEYGNLGFVVRRDTASALCADGAKCPFTAASDGSLWVRLTNTSLAVTGTFWQATQPISAAALPLPTGAASEATLAAANGNLAAIYTEVADIATKATTGNANTGASATSLAVLDDWDESDRAKVNPIVGQAGVQGGSGAVSATTQRVVLATDVALPTGTNTIGATDRVAVAAANQPGACVTVDGTSDAILASNASRRGFTITNAGSTTFYLKLGATATTSNGAIPPGASFSITSGAIYTGAVDGITSSGSTSVCAWEW